MSPRASQHSEQMAEDSPCPSARSPAPGGSSLGPHVRSHFSHKCTRIPWCNPCLASNGNTCSADISNNCSLVETKELEDEPLNILPRDAAAFQGCVAPSV